jgi:hypothetical protein
MASAQLHRLGDRDRLSLAVIASDIEGMGEMRLDEYLAWTVENYVLRQSSKVAAKKLPEYRYFILREDEGFRLVKEQNPRSYLSYDPSRIDSAYRLMADLKLVSLDNGFRLTQAGRKVLERMKAHHRANGERERRVRIT